MKKIIYFSIEFLVNRKAATEYAFIDNYSIDIDLQDPSAVLNVFGKTIEWNYGS